MNMTKKRVAELEGAQLDWAVAKAEGRCLHQNTEYYAHQSDTGFTCLDCGKDTYHEACGRDWKPSSSWAQGGPIIERERIGVRWTYSSAYNSGAWVSMVPRGDHATSQLGPTPLIAAMRAFVASKLGDEVEVPE